MQGKTAVGLALAALGALPVPGVAAAQAPAFSQAEVRAILAHGPWPAPATRDPSNRVSGKREAIELGERLFFERRLSGSGTFSCATCHVPERNWTDNRTRGAAAAEVDRNTPTLMNLRLGRWFGWSGAADSLWAQSLRPILDARELAASASHVARVLRTDEELACRYRRAFGAPPPATDDEAVLVGVAKALAAFQETFDSPPTPFDRFRDALARGGPIPAGLYSEAAQRGLKIFVGKGDCSSCHAGANFSSGEFHDNGFSALGRADAGRLEGVKALRASRFNRAGPYSDDAKAAPELPASGEPGAFKVPTLRHLMLTAPYGHHGEIETIADVVRHYSERGSAARKPLRLTAAEQSDLVVFLESLSTLSNPWRAEDAAACR